MRLIRCTIDPLINHEARINHDKVAVVALVSESERAREANGTVAAPAGAPATEYPPYPTRCNVAGAAPPTSRTRAGAEATSGSHSTAEQWMSPPPGTAGRYCRTGSPNPAK